MRKKIVNCFILFLILFVYAGVEVDAKKTEPKYLSNALKLLLRAKNAKTIKRKKMLLPRAHHQVRSDRKGNLEKKEIAKDLILSAYKLLKQKKVEQAELEIDKAIIEIKAAMPEEELKSLKD